MTPQELKNSILQLAIQGKLVEQRPEEGTAEELYKKIQAEKQKLIKAGKIKKENPLPEITEDEVPFEIPESWKWVRLSDCGLFVSGFTPKANELCSNGKVPYFKVSDMNTEGNELWLKKTSLFLKDTNPKRFFKKNTIVYPKNGGAVFTNKRRILAQDSIIDLNTGGYTFFGPINLSYLYLFFVLIDFRLCYKGTALPTLDLDKLKMRCFPLPPLAEQKRIVAKIEELLPLADRYGEAWDRLEELNKRFPDDMRKSVLQLAIQGKLVEQRPEEGTAEELYKKIQAEKQKLIKTGKIKKEKPLPEITEDEIPFEIPESWKWVRIGEITFNAGQKKPDRQFSYIDVGSIDNINHSLNKKETIIEAKDAPSRARKIVKYGDIIFATIRPYLQNICIINRKFKCEAIASTAFAVMSCPEGLYNKFLFFSLLSPSFMSYVNASDKAKGVTYPAIAEKDFFTGIIPLPPLTEQKRIVAKIEDILAFYAKLRNINSLS